FYVAASRRRESLTVITSDKDQSQQSIGISGERPSPVRRKSHTLLANREIALLNRLRYCVQPLEKSKLLRLPLPSFNS
ncbi:MAG: hypothetical protein M3Y27_20020, partial [Acidobacteriota bacterium]|nr:hypothetical protein [Acidobacteriota bacterium]